jgi:hypothetical protein
VPNPTGRADPVRVDRREHVRLLGRHQLQYREAALQVPDKRTIRVFMASPGDLAIERRAFKDAIDELNEGFDDGEGVKCIPLGWEDKARDRSQTATSQLKKEG